MTTDYVVPGLTRRVERRRAEARHRRRANLAAGGRVVAGVVLCLCAVALATGAQLAIWFAD